MGFYSGNTGTIQFKRFEQEDTEGYRGTGKLKITQWTMNTSAQLLDTTCLSEYDKNSVYGIRTHTGSLRLLYYTPDDYSTPVTNDASWFIGALTKPRFMQNAGGDFADDRSPEAWQVRLKLYIKGPPTVQGDYSGFQDSITFDANLTSVGYASTVNEVTSVDVQFEAIGRIDITNL